MASPAGKSLSVGVCVGRASPGLALSPCVHAASKVDSKEHGADLTPKAIDDSLKNLGTGMYHLFVTYLVEPS